MTTLDIKYFLDDGAYTPTRAHEWDAGFDLYAPTKLFIDRQSSGVIDTGVHVEIPSGYVGFIKSKSGLNVKSGLVAEGVIDSGYTGSIVVKLYNHSDRPYIFEKGNKLTQLVFLPIPYVTLIEDSNFADSTRGDNGFGSSGK